MRPWAVSAGLHLAALLLAVLWWPAGAPGPTAVRLSFGPPPSAVASAARGASTLAAGRPAAPAAPAPVPASAARESDTDAAGAGEPAAGPVAEAFPGTLQAAAGPVVPEAAGSPETLAGQRPTLRRAAVLTAYPAPAYPTRLRAQGVEGTVVVGVEVDPTGAVRRVWVESSSGQPEFDRRAVDAVRKAEFQSAREDDRTVAGETTVTVRFRLTS